MDMNAYRIAELLHAMVKGEEGGGTVRRTESPLPSGGYYVGGIYPSLVFPSVDTFDRGEVAWWIGNHFASFYGVWVDSTDGKVYVDAVSHFHFIKNALDNGKARGEIAIWGIKENEEIRVDSHED
jgi:hypothetical protein